MNMRGTLVAVATAFLLLGCSTLQETVSPSTKGEQALERGIKAYEKGEYADTVREINSALALSQPTREGPAKEGLGTKDLVSAHKYLAFTYCVTARERQCREEFKKALELNPNLELEPAEAGHPIWGPVFKSVKNPPKPAASAKPVAPTTKSKKK